MEPTSDELLRRSVLEELAWDALVDQTNVDVEVDYGVVTLVGTVSNLATKLAAQQAVLAVVGVRDVANRIDVKVPADSAHADEEMENVLRHVLAWDALVPEENIQVSVVDGWVALAGGTPTVRQSEEAERAISHITGVRGVTNHIMIEPGGLGPDEVRNLIEQAVVRRAVHRANRIDVVVDDGRVTLSGPVQSEAERQAILGAVSHGAGVTAVCDELVAVA